MTTTTAEPPQRVPWEFGLVGFDTSKHLWFVQLYDELNRDVGTYMARQLVVVNGSSSQFDWKDPAGRPMWHVRERIFLKDVQVIGTDPEGLVLTIVFKKPPPLFQTNIARITDYSYILYAFHLGNKTPESRAPMGFVELYDANDKLLTTLDDRWIFTEGVSRKSVGEYPKIRLRVDRMDVGELVVTTTAVFIRGPLSSVPNTTS